MLPSSGVKSNDLMPNLLSTAIGVITPFRGQVNLLYGMAGAVFCLAGHYIGSGMVIKNGSKIVRPIIIFVLVLLFVKILLGI